MDSIVHREELGSVCELEIFVCVLQNSNIRRCQDATVHQECSMGCKRCKETFLCDGADPFDLSWSTLSNEHVPNSHRARSNRVQLFLNENQMFTRDFQTRSILCLNPQKCPFGLWLVMTKSIDGFIMRVFPACQNLISNIEVHHGY